MIGCIFAENGSLEGGIESNSGVPAGVLRVISDGFLASIRALSNGRTENGPLEGGIESSFSGTGWGAKGDFRWIFDPNPCILEESPPPFSESTCPELWAQKVWG